MPKKRHIATWTDDPLVPIDGSRIEAALKAADLSRRECARLIGMRKEDAPKFDHVVTKQRRCRRSLRRKLASVLRRRIGFVTEEWLSGEGGLALPDGADLLWDSNYRLRSGRIYPRSRRGDDGEIVSEPELYEFPPGYELEAARLVQVLAQAIERDRAQGIDHGLSEESLTVVVSDLLSVLPWHAYIFGDDLQDVDVEQANDFAVHMAEVVRHILRPWLAGERSFASVQGIDRGDRLLRLADAIRHLAAYVNAMERWGR